MKTLKLSILTSICCAFYITNAYSQEVSRPSVDQRLFYLGVDQSISYPSTPIFRGRKSENDISLKKFTNYSAKVGYSFYPQMALEILASYQPNYDLNYILPDIYFKPTKISGKVKVVSQIYNLNLVYDLKSYMGITPYVGGGIGITRLAVKASDPIRQRQDLFYIKSNKQNFFTWQTKLGALKNITDNLAFNLGGQLHAIQNTKINYVVTNIASGSSSFGTIKKTIYSYQLGVGIIYRIPVKG